MRQYWRERRKRVVSMVSKKVGHDHVEEALRKKSPRVPRGIDENDSCMRYAVGGKKRNVLGWEWVQVSNGGPLLLPLGGMDNTIIIQKLKYY